MKMRILFALLAGILPAAAVNAATINELRVDQSGTDNDEFVELYGAPGESLDGLSFVILQDNGSIDGVVDLTGQSIGSSGFFVMAEGTFSIGTADLTTTLNLENGENSSYLLVDGLTGSQGDDLDSDDDGVFDAALPWTSIVDGLSMIDDEDSILDGGTEDIDYSAALGVPVIGPDATFYPASVAAIPDGSDNYAIIPFSELGENTPGASNIPEPGAVALALLSLASAGVVSMRSRLG